MPAPAIVVSDVHKRFARPAHQVHTLKERVLHPFRRDHDTHAHALEEIDFEVAEGEFFGIVGRNGSGKSTLLKMLAGIYGSDAGEIWVRGRVSTFIELGVGFNPDLAARDNVMLNAVMLGLSPAEAKERYERIIEFAELQDHQDLKLKNYSSGMHVRLAFSVMVEVDADVLLIDEVLAVGDAAFQQKCFDQFARLRDEGRTIVLVTHDMGSVRRFCDRAMLIEDGRVIDVGDPEVVGNRYLDLNFSEARGEAAADIAAGRADADRQGDRRAEILSLRVEDVHGEQRTTVRQGDDLVLRARVRFHEAMQNPSIGFSIEDDVHRMLVGANSMWKVPHTGSYAAGEEAEMTLRLENRFVPGRYFVSPAVADQRSGLELADNRLRFGSFVSTGTVHTGGVVDLDYDIALRAAEASPATVTGAS